MVDCKLGNCKILLDEATHIEIGGIGSVRKLSLTSDMGHSLIYNDSGGDQFG
jgi:hypothetical protein